MVHFIRAIFLIGIFCIPNEELLSQYISKDNYTGNWETPESWNPVWTSPQTNINGFDITIYGYITLNGSLDLSGNTDNMTINDTLVILGNLSINNQSTLTINNNGILIIKGNLTMNNQSVIIADGYLVVTGNFNKLGALTNGSLTSNDNPVKVFIGGTVVPADITSNNPGFPVLNCTVPPTTPYPNSACSYGNMSDFENDPMYSFFQMTCTIVTPTISAGGPTSFCVGGSVTLTSSGGDSYLWSTGETTQSINVTVSGSYFVKVISTEGCQSAASVSTIVTVNAMPAAPTISASGPTTFCNGGNVILTSSDATSYLWSTGATASSIDIVSAGSYYVAVTDANGCGSTVSATTTVNVNALPVINAGTEITIPNGTSTTIDATVTGTGPFSYSWSPSGMLVNPLIEDPVTVNLAASTVYTLTATSATTSCSNTGTVIISVSGGLLDSYPAASPATVCAGENVHLYALAGGGSGSYTYNWTSAPVGFSSSVADPIVNPLVSTTYYVAVNDGFTTVNSQVIVTVNALPVTPSIVVSGPVTFCAGGNITLTSGPGTSYLWSTGATTQSINVTEAGAYSVKVTNTAGCTSSVSIPEIVTVNPIPSTPTITTIGPATFCDGGSVTLNASAGINYLWSNGATSSTINVTAAGNYSVSISSANGCKSASSVPTIVTVHALPSTPNITSSGPLVFCEGGSVTLTSSPGTIYSWSTGATKQGIDVTSAGTYTVEVTDANGCESAVTAAATVVIDPLPLVSITSSSVMCVSDLMTLTGNPAGGIFVVIDGPGSISGNVLSATGAGNIEIEYTYTNVCSNMARQTVIVGDKPVAVAGSDQLLKYLFETNLEGVLSGSETGEWSLITGSGKISDIHSPASRVTELSVGENTLLWTVRNDFCESGDEVTITVIDLFVPSVITPNGDGKNDYFQITDIGSRVELIIINRWGEVEYTNNNYINEWDGRNKKGRELPNDTYLYIIKFENGIIRKGTVLITR